MEKTKASYLSTTSLANLIALVALAAAIFFNGYQLVVQNGTLSSTEKIGSAQYVLALSDKVNAPKYTSIMNAIENGTQNTPITSKGAQPKFSQIQLENYIGNFETIGDLVNEGVIDKNMAYQEFSYDVAKAWCNKDVQKEIASDRAIDQNSTGKDEYWNGFQYLATYAMTRDRATSCSYYDNQ